jgi:hypothetical protein
MVREESMCPNTRQAFFFFLDDVGKYTSNKLVGNLPQTNVCHLTGFQFSCTMKAL